MSRGRHKLKKAKVQSYTRVRIGSASPKTPEEMCELSPEEILAELSNNLPVSSFFDEPSQEGLASVLRVAVAKCPELFTPIAPNLLRNDIPPLYTSYILQGFQTALTQGKSFDWKPLLMLCDKVSRTTEKEIDGEPPDMQPGYWERTYAGARKNVAQLLEIGLVRSDNAIPLKSLKLARNILLVLADDLNPSPEYEHKWGIEHPHGILGLSVTRKKAIEALLKGALSVARIKAQGQETKKGAPAKERMEKVVKAKLTEKLDKQIDPSLAVHSVFGQYFPNLHYLDQEWAVAHLEDIFPRRSEMPAYWEAAWDGYMFRNDFFVVIYKILRSYYRYAIERIGLVTPEVELNFSRARLIKHLSAAYWHGVETLEDNSLIISFFEIASDEMRARFISALGIALGDTKPSANSEEWLRAKALLEARFLAISQAVEDEEQIKDFVKELGAFSRWAPNIPDDLKSYYQMIKLSGLVSENPDALQLLKFLSSVAQYHASFVVSLLEKLLQQDRGDWFLVGEKGTIRTILEAAKRFGDEQARDCAERIIILFGERGDDSYKDLLRL